MKQTTDDLIEELSKGIRTQDDLVSLTKMLTKKVLETALNTELDEHLGYDRHHKSDTVRVNNRNGSSSKSLKTDFGKIELSTPRDRDSSFKPKIIKKHQTKFEGFDEKIIALYAKGMTTRDIQEIIKDLYNADISHSSISNITDRVIDDVVEWQSRPLDSIYPILYLDCISVKIHQDNRVISKSIYIALGINLEGYKDVLGLWISENEGSKFWLSVLTELQNRGLKDCYIACVDGLKGFPEAIKTAYPKTKIQLCIVHMVRNSLRYVPSKDMKLVAKDLKSIYNSATRDLAEKTLSEFSDKWSSKYPSIERSWRRNWDNIITLFDYPSEIRKIIYTTNAIESLNSVIRKSIKNRKIFPNDTSALKIIYLSIINASRKWTMPLRDWSLALNRFEIEYEDRFEQ